jgi:hypothetical protein
MNYKPNENDWLSYLYGELEGPEREKVEQYLLGNAEARKEFEQFRQLRSMMGAVADKEVIAPPIFVDDNKQRYFWNTTYFKMVLSVAASLLLVMVVGKLMDIQISAGGNEFRMSFGTPQKKEIVSPAAPSLSPTEVQQMINASLNENNLAMQTSWKETQEMLDQSIRTSLASNSGKIDQLVRQASTASQDQIRQYVSTLQAENAAMVKNYLQLSSTEQKDYIEDLLVDFAKFIQQQRQDDLQVVQSKLNNIEQNTNVFKQETEQILSSIITTVGNPVAQQETKY